MIVYLYWPSKAALHRLVGTAPEQILQEDFVYIFKMFEFRDNHIKSQGQKLNPNPVAYR